MGWGFYLGEGSLRAAFEHLIVHGRKWPVLRVTHHDRVRIFVLQEIDEAGEPVPCEEVGGRSC